MRQEQDTDTEPVEEEAATVLLVDDDAGQLELTAALLGKAGYRVVTASGVREAAEAARRDRPDLVITDMIMRDGGGVDVVSALREDHATHPTPILLLSALAQGSERAAEGLRAGADGFLEIPYDPPRLLASAARLIEQSRAAEGLRASEERFRLLVEGVKDYAIFMTDPQGRIVSWNEGVRRVLRYDEGEFPGLHVSVIFTPEDVAAGAPEGEMQTALAEGRADDERWHVRKGGELFWASGVVTPLRDEAGRLRGFAKVMRDNTERKLAEAERERLLGVLGFERSRLEQILRQVPAGVSVVEAPTGRRLFVNEEAEVLLGHKISTGEDYRGYASMSALHTDGRPYESDEYPTVRALLRGETVKGEEMLYRRGDGRVVTLSVNSTPIVDAQGRVAAVATIFTDITERKRAETQRERFLALGSDLLAVAGFDGRFRWVSPAWERLLGWTARELTSRPWLDFVHPEDKGAAVEEARELSEGRGTVLFENRYLCKDGSHRWIGWKTAAYPEEELFYSAAADVTERKEAEAERERLLAREQEARAEAEEANRLKDDFLATLSHELRTPLTSILGWSRMLRSGTLPAEMSGRALEAVERNAQTQKQLIDDLLDVSRIISGKLHMESRPVAMVSVVEAAVETVRPAAEAKNVRLQVVAETGTGTVIGDSDRLQQVVWNLLSNAVKFTPEGGEVSARLERGESSVRLSVSDTGSGIRPEFLPHVFDRFRQADASASRQMGGLGLGLAIVRHIVEAHGGAVTAESEGEGRGATFNVTLPVVPAERPSVTRPHTAASSGVSCPPVIGGLKVLVVDDDPDTLDYVAAVLEHCGAVVRRASTAAEALAALKQEAADVLVSDIGLPGQDGYELMRKVRKLPRGRGGRVPAVALTAYAREEDRMEAYRAGFQMHLSKPVAPDDLLTVIANLVGEGGGG